MQTRLDDTLNVHEKPALFGAQRHPGLVCAQAAPGSAPGGEPMTIYRREEGRLYSETDLFRPFLWLAEPDLIRGLDEHHLQVEQLAGQNVYRYLVSAENWRTILEVSRVIAERAGVSSGHPQSPQLLLNDRTTQYLMATGQTYYNRMELNELHCLVVRTYTRSELFGPSTEKAHRLAAIALRTVGTNAGFELLAGDEAELLEQLQTRVAALDPDLIVGHNLFKRDLQRLDSRAGRRRKKLALGRDGHRLSWRKARTQIAEKALDYPRFSLPGRELVDCWILAVLSDVSAREMEGYDLDEVAHHLELPSAPPQETIEERAARDTENIASIWQRSVYPYFLQSQIFPLSFEDVILRGNATRINLLFLREYYRRKHSVPTKPEARHFAGGLTALEHQGCAFGVYHCDVASLYPSLILTYGLTPSGDELGIFTGLLEDLRDFRLLTKQQAREAGEPALRDFYHNLQTTFKILINSFYGYLGFSQGHFADFDRAAQVTQHGRELLTKMMEWLKVKGAALLEVDTDGIYFVPSERFATTDWLDELNGELPPGVQVEFDGRYPAMYCHKMKNYALLEDSGQLIIRGSGLRSRATEPYLLSFIEELIRTALKTGPEVLEEVVQRYTERVSSGELTVEEVAKTETLIDSPSTYSKKIEQGKRNRAAVYELALSAPEEFQAGESLSYYVVGDRATVTVYDSCKRVEAYNPEEPDLNRKYYLKKLKATYKKFAPILTRPALRCPISYAELPAPE